MVELNLYGIYASFPILFLLLTFKIHKQEVLQKLKRNTTFVWEILLTLEMFNSIKGLYISHAQFLAVFQYWNIQALPSLKSYRAT